MGFKFELFGNLKKKVPMPTSKAPKTNISDDLSSIPDMASQSTPMPPMPAINNTPMPQPQTQMNLNSDIPQPQMVALPQASPQIMADVNNLVAKGVPEADMVKELKDKGYNFQEIDDALGQAIKTQVSGENLSAINPAMAAEQPTSNDVTDTSSDFSEQMQYQSESSRDSNLEAMIESVVEDRLSLFKKQIDKINVSIDDIKSEIENLDVSLKSVENHTDNTITDIKKEMDVQRDDFSKVLPKITSIEVAFKDVVPNIIDAITNINEKLHMTAKEIDVESLDVDESIEDKDNSIKDKPEQKEEVSSDVNIEEEKSKPKEAEISVENDNKDSF